MKEYADKPGNQYDVKALAERMVAQYRLTADAEELAREFFEEHEANEWWLNGAPIRSWKRLFEGKLKRMREQERGKSKPKYHTKRFCVCDICWNPLRNHDIEGLQECNCVSRCVKEGKKLMYLLENGAKPSKILMAVFEGKINVMEDDDVQAVETYYKACRLHYITIYNHDPESLEVYEHIRHYHDRLLKENGEEYHARVQPFKQFMIDRESGGEVNVSHT